MTTNSTQSKRGEQLNALRKLQLPNWSDVRPGVAKAVLRAVDGYGAQCWASIQTLSAETQFSPRAVQCSLSHLVEIGYLSTSKRVGQTSTFSVQWDKLTHVSLTGVGDVDPRQSDTPPTSDRHPTHVSLTGDPRQTDTLYVNETKKETKKKRNTSSLRFSDEDLKFAGLMFEKIVQVAPKEKRPKTFDKWANTIRLMRESDNITLEEMTSVFNWANSDPFWKSNIRSPDKLREKFAALDAKMRNPSPTFSKPTSANVGVGVVFNPERKAGW